MSGVACLAVLCPLLASNIIPEIQEYVCHGDCLSLPNQETRKGSQSRRCHCNVMCNPMCKLNNPVTVTVRCLHEAPSLFFSPHSCFSWHKAKGDGMLQGVGVGGFAVTWEPWEGWAGGPGAGLCAGYFQPKGRKRRWAPTLFPIMVFVSPGSPGGTMVISSPGFTPPHSEDAQIIFCKVQKEEGEVFYPGLFFCSCGVERDHFIALILYFFSKSKLYFWWISNI